MNLVGDNDHKLQKISLAETHRKSMQNDRPGGEGGGKNSMTDDVTFANTRGVPKVMSLHAFP